MSIDKASLQFAKETEKLIDAVAKEMAELSSQLTKEELILVLRELDMDRFILEEMGYMTTIDKLMSEYPKVLEGTQFFSSISTDVLDSLVYFDRQKYLQRASQLGVILQDELLKSIISGVPVDQLKSVLLSNTDLNPNHVDTIVNTSLQTFSRSVIRLQAENMPENSKYMYVGIVDGRNRDVCLEMMSAGALTIKQIEMRFPSSLSYGCGYNCRGHRWQLVTDYTKGLVDLKEAKRLRTERMDGGKYAPFTLSQMMENKSG